MIKEFEKVQEQLLKLAPVINSFKSESVQLKILELIFSNKFESTSAEPKPNKIRKRKPKSNDDKLEGKTKTKKKKTSGRPGPGAMIDNLIAEKYFKGHKHSASDIVQHTKDKLAFSYLSTEINVALGRALRNNKLKRELNENGQYVYYSD